MSSNVLGTLFRIAMIAFSLFCLWFLSVVFIYTLVVLLFNTEFSFKFLFILFVLVLTFRMFYPKNVFNCD